jgi:predicted metal-dependent hydrolase
LTSPENGEGIDLDGEERIIVKGREFTIETKRVSGSTARVGIRGSTVTIKLPFYMSERNAINTYSDFREWAIKRLEKIDHAQLDPKPRFIDFKDGQELEAMGRRFILRIQEQGKRSSAMTTPEGTIVVRTAAGLAEGERKKKAYSLIRREITRNVADDFKLHVRGLNGRYFDFELNGILIRDQMTRWGSCSRSTKNITLNFRLLLAPDEIRDYVIIHELAHLKHPNHSKRFWSLVYSVIPDYKEKKKWLNKNGNRIGIQEDSEKTRTPEDIPNPYLT